MNDKLNCPTQMFRNSLFVKAMVQLKSVIHLWYMTIVVQWCWKCVKSTILYAFVLKLFSLDVGMV